MEFQIKEQIQVLFEYMKINDPLERVDIIIGCGCANTQIPRRCAELLLKGYAPYIIFTGGKGKCTEKLFQDSEANVFKQIAMECGVEESKIFIEEHSNNLPQNLMYCKQLIEEKGLVANRILMVHSPATTRRTLATAKVYLAGKEILITTPIGTFDSYIKQIQCNNTLEESISVLVGNIQRMLITPPIGYQIAEEVPQKVIQAYQIVKQAGYDKYVYSKEEIDDLIRKHGLMEGAQPNYFI